MAVLVSKVEKGSAAERSGFVAGDVLVSINNMEINDVLDFRFYMVATRLKCTVIAQGKTKTIRVKKDEYEELGLVFDTYLMDKQRRCKNGCIFCFVDQMPPGLRESLYFKDDDSRMSFLFGNYVTLTNMSDDDIARIIEMHISPINISVHTMNPQLRVHMMKNKRAGESLKYIEQLAGAGISINAQLVLCPGVNDGGELQFSLERLGSLYPAVQSIAVVPVGLTKYREGLADLKLYTPEQAANTIDIVEAFGNVFYEQHGERLAFPADELFIKAGRHLPKHEYYGSFDQLENGVGLVSLLEHEFCEAMKSFAPPAKPKRISLATGVDAAPFMDKLLKMVQSRYPDLSYTVYAIRNDFFGESITVAGLVTGGDLIRQLKGQDLGEQLLIPAVMLRHERDLFLDGVSLEEAQTALKVNIRPVENDGYTLLSAIVDFGE